MKYSNKKTASLSLDLKLPLIKGVAIVQSYSASRITWHSHNCYELLLLSEGATAYEFKDGAVADLKGGQFLVIPPKVIHRGLNNVRSPASLCGIMIDPQAANSTKFTPFSTADLAWIRSNLEEDARHARSMSIELRSLVKKLRAEVENFERSTRQSVLSLRLILFQILVEIESCSSDPASCSPASTVDLAVKFMRANLKEPTSLHLVAKAAGCSRSRLFTIFKQETGLTPNDYWQRLRIEEAYQRVLSTSDSNIKIAMDCGFATSQYFCTVFRKYWGVSPRACRLLNNKSLPR